MEQLYSIKELAKMLGVTYITIYRHIAFCQTCVKKYNQCQCSEFNPIIKAFNISGKDSKITWRIPLSAVEKLLNKRVNKIK